MGEGVTGLEVVVACVAGGLRRFEKERKKRRRGGERGKRPFLEST